VRPVTVAAASLGFGLQDGGPRFKIEVLIAHANPRIDFNSTMLRRVRSLSAGEL
jgi:hypothetical protein